ncbi:MAG: hypothetical protein RL358_76 [Pseudomonadota bacterium]
MKLQIASWLKPWQWAIGVIVIAAGLSANYFWFSELRVAPSVNTSLLAQLPNSFAFTQAVPEAVKLDTQKVALGKRLFLDVRLSRDDTVACLSCHDLNTGGTDNRARSIGVAGGMGAVNAPTVLNSGFNFVQFWDGRAVSLEAQVDGPVNHPQEMASTWPLVLSKLTQDAMYVAQFNALYEDGMTVSNIKNALAIFERSLITPNSRFDKFLRGDQNALNAQEKQGYALFQSSGCASCHQGVNLGGNMYEKMGLMGDYFADRGNLTDADNGRYNVTHNPDNMHEFRVPSLRNVALTAPYFHDGNAATLEQAINIMVKYQLGRAMPAEDIDSIAAFLRTLTGELTGLAAQYQGNPL